MKDKIIYVVIFVFAFVAVTGGIIYLNSSYENIFAFNFTHTAEAKEIVEKPKDNNNWGSSDSLRNILGGLIDSIKSGNYYKDTIHVQNVADTTLLDTIRILKQKLDELSKKKDEDAKLLAQKKDAKNKKEVKNTSEVKTDSVKLKENDLATKIQPKDSVYKAWVKKTGSLYEAMDSRKAAKIIATYSDNIAKDILYAMKKKKAAEILGQLNPEIVNRITSTK